MANTLKVTLVKSPIGAVPKHKKTVAAMGLTKMHKTVEMPDNAATRGMIQQVQHLVKVLSTAITSEEAVDMVLETVKQPVKDTKDS